MSYTGKVNVTMALATVSEANSHAHWRVRQKRAKHQRRSAYLALCGAMRKDRTLPATVILVRLSPRELDDDNLHGALKHVRDGVADFFGVDDRDNRYTWRVAQEKCRTPGVRIEIECAGTALPASADRGQR